MKNEQQEPELNPLWGLTKKPLSNKSKEKRILETVNRIVTRIRYDETPLSDLLEDAADLEGGHDRYL
jgi:hypothetical protein